ncbi:MAG TPA: VWA domain-containing protein [Thermoanaerobaculia bacterium]|jgi:VWFA-related protein|nr:VWA domain-containing protein [Thermoanaerobaculia bacterium]
MRYAPFLAVLLVSALPLPAQELSEPPADQAAFDDVIDVRVINVEAVVTGRNGERVRGLTKDDFRLLVDGREVPIEFFNEVANGTMVNSQASGTSEAPEAPEEAPEPEVVGRSVLVFIDDSYAIASQRNMVLDKLQESLSKLSPHDEVAITAFDGTTLKLLLDWTSDPRDIVETLDLARARKPNGLLALVHKAQQFPDVAARQFDAVNAAAAAMRGVPGAEGRKVMLLLSGGWPMDALPSPYAFGRRRKSMPNTGEEMFRPLVDAANLLGYTLYPVDLPGVSTTPGPGAQAEGPIPVEFISSGEEQAAEYTLNYLAQATGGKAAINSARLEALERMTADTGSYYWLGFTPDWKADNQRHRIELQPRKRGLSVRTRESFTDVSCEAQIYVNEDGSMSSTPCFAR